MPRLPRVVVSGLPDRILAEILRVQWGPEARGHIDASEFVASRRRRQSNGLPGLSSAPPRSRCRSFCAFRIARPASGLAFHIEQSCRINAEILGFNHVLLVEPDLGGGQ